VWLATVAEKVRGAAAGGRRRGAIRPGSLGSHFWGFERRGTAFLPDIVTLGKPVGNGYPMGVVIADRRLIEAFQARFGFFSTFGGNPVAAAAGLAVLQVLDREQLVPTRAPAAKTCAGIWKSCRAGTSAWAVCVAPACCSVSRYSDRMPMWSETHQGNRQLAGIAGRVLIGAEGPAANILKLRPPMPFV